MAIVFKFGGAVSFSYSALKLNIKLGVGAASRYGARFDSTTIWLLEVSAQHYPGKHLLNLSPLKGKSHEILMAFYNFIV
jgi:hypothetical protein